MTLRRALPSLDTRVAAPCGEVDHLSRLAHDFDRWGLAPEAEVARLRYRQRVVDGLILQGQETSSRATSERSRPLKQNPQSS